MKKVLYLSGSIEYSKDPSSWRNTMEKELYTKYEIINPAAQYCPLVKNNSTEYKKWIYDRFVIPDIEYVLKCSHFFVKIDKATGRGSGTWSELTLATYLNKHIIYMFDNITPPDIPGWSLGCLAYALQVNTLDEAIKYYKGL